MSTESWKRLSGESQEAAHKTASGHTPSDVEGLRAAVDETHQLLDAEGIPSAENAICDDPACTTKLGHRVRELIRRQKAGA